MSNQKEYTIYCDESRHESGPGNPFMAIGGLWVPRECKVTYTKELRELKETLDLRAEVKWSKTSSKRLSEYKKLIDYFVVNEMSFRVIVVDQNKADYDRFKAGDAEMGFYTFYYEMLEKWLFTGCGYNILLDFKKNKETGREGVLRRCLESGVSHGAIIHDLNVIDSAESPLAQICDLLTGATAAVWCGTAKGSPKAILADYIARGVSLSSLKQKAPNAGFTKFNIFKINLS